MNTFVLLEMEIPFLHSDLSAAGNLYNYICKVMVFPHCRGSKYQFHKTIRNTNNCKADSLSWQCSVKGKYFTELSQFLGSSFSTSFQEWQDFRWCNFAYMMLPKSDLILSDLYSITDSVKNNIEIRVFSVFCLKIHIKDRKLTVLK